MAAANMQLQQQLANAQQPVEVEDTEEVVITDTNIAPRTVFFKIGSDKLSPQEEMNLSYLASKIKRISEHYIHNQRICRLCNRYSGFQPEVEFGTCTSC